MICGHCGRPRANELRSCRCVPQGFWDRPDVTDALRARDARTVLCLLHRSAPDLTHDSLAAMCGLVQSTITRALSGRGLTRPDVVAQVFTGLGAPTFSRGPIASSESDGVVHSWESRLNSDANETLDQARAVLDRATPAPLLDMLEADVDRLCRTYVHTPLTDLYSQIIERRRYALRLLANLSHPDQSHRVHTAAARLVGLQAHVSLDVGAYPHARTHATTAQALAEQTGDHSLRAWVGALHSLIAYWDGRPGDAQHAAEAALTHHVTDSNLIRLHALRARAAATQGDRKTTLAALAEAEDYSDLPVPAGVLGFPPGKLHSYAGTALLALESPSDRRRSLAHAEHAITLYSSTPDRSIGDLLAARLDLATAHTRTGELEGALEQIAVITSTPQGHRTASITKRSQRLIRLVEGNTAGPARRIHEQLEAFVRPQGPTSTTGR